MIEEDPLCPDCGYELTGIEIFKDDDNGEITIEFFCDGASEDRFGFQIMTGITDENITNLTKIGKVIRRQMGISMHACKACIPPSLNLFEKFLVMRARSFCI